MDTENYIAECKRELNDTSSYKIIENDPTQKHWSAIQISGSKKSKTRKSCERPKVYKKGNPGQPV